MVMGKKRPMNNVRKTMRIATWNVRTLYKSGMLVSVTREMCRSWESQRQEWQWLLHATVYPGGDQHQSGFGVILASHIVDNMLAYNPVCRQDNFRLKATPFNISFIYVYAPTAAATDAEMEEFSDGILVS